VRRAGAVRSGLGSPLLQRSRRQLCRRGRCGRALDALASMQRRCSVDAAACAGGVASTGHAHRGEVARPRQPRQHHRVWPVGLDPVPAAPGDQRWRHHLALRAQRGEVASDHEPARAGFIHDVHPVAFADQLAQRLVQRHKIAASAAHMAHLAVALRIRRGKVDAVQVRSPIRRTACQFSPWPVSLQLRNDLTEHRPGALVQRGTPRRATYAVARDGPPEVTKPSCLGLTKVQCRGGRARLQVQYIRGHATMPYAAIRGATAGWRQTSWHVL